ncbi:MAG: hypothetical protein P4L90_09885 [Rhodopila sp.]|nr:hypothetical protein [Rhodopila sp.]
MIALGGTSGAGEPCDQRKSQTNFRLNSQPEIGHEVSDDLCVAYQATHRRRNTTLAVTLLAAHDPPWTLCGKDTS